MCLLLKKKFNKATQEFIELLLIVDDLSERNAVLK